MKIDETLTVQLPEAVLDALWLLAERSGHDNAPEGPGKFLLMVYKGKERWFPVVNPAWFFSPLNPLESLMRLGTDKRPDTGPWISLSYFEVGSETEIEVEVSVQANFTDTLIVPTEILHDRDKLLAYVETHFTFKEPDDVLSFREARVVVYPDHGTLVLREG